MAAAFLNFSIPQNQNNYKNYSLKTTTVMSCDTKYMKLYKTD